MEVEGMELGLKRRQSENVLISEGEADAEGKDLCQCVQVWARKHHHIISKSYTHRQRTLARWGCRARIHSKCLLSLAVNGSWLKETWCGVSAKAKAKGMIVDLEFAGPISNPDSPLILIFTFYD